MHFQGSHLARKLTKSKKAGEENKIRDVKGEITRGITEIQRIIGKYIETILQLLEKPRTNGCVSRQLWYANIKSTGRRNLRRLKPSNETEALTKVLPTKKSPGPD